MYTPSQSFQTAILHSDECYICKQNECLMIQQGHTILVLEYDDEYDAYSRDHLLGISVSI